MTQLSISALFDGERVLSIVAGEDRVIAVGLLNTLTQLPYDMTGANASVGLPRLGGGTLRRCSAPYTAINESVSLNTQGFGAIIIPNHGFVTGDIVTFATAVTSGVLPAPLAAQTPYTLVVYDNNTLGVQDTSGNAVTLTTQGTGIFSIELHPPMLTVSNPQLGLLTLTLPAYVTMQLNTLIGQSFQINIITGGSQRIVLCDAALDVQPQPAP